ncbi:Chromodomain-helicase-DNA-binding protein Mi-2 isogeny [Artemisia annua]|uniref:Chromodomain-helicase-DNA-binding protein Mi-2 isogeny n=1 Tax=Artemisia annua TaxID=35608 RepID=A0A2U1MXU0_ARTAN|nr:Chromodomain-helicase-DNA-binding protein Mi-2 isogeny [Artemisia annua]
MAAINEGAKLMCGGLRVYNSNPRLLLNEKAEVRCVDEGFQGSWHGGTVVDQKNHIRLIQYDHYDGLTESVPVWKPYNIPNWRGNIRPIPPLLTHNQNSLHYGQCVDALFDKAWWEGVIFDHDDGCEERLVFFPDRGDELRVHFENTRLTQEWNAHNDEWKVRCDWVFLKVFEELELEWPVLISAKQIWFKVRVKKRFRNDMCEWTCNAKEKWKNIVKEVIFDNFSLHMKEFYCKLNSSYCTQAVIDYHLLVSGRTCDLRRLKKDSKFRKMKNRAKKHMLTVGWAKYENILGHKLVRYKSPSGKRFKKLSQACKRYIWESLSNKNDQDVQKDKDQLENENDYICSVCHYGGELVLCDKCPSSFHISCVGLEEVPDEEWCCPMCCCKVCNQNRYEKHCGQSTDGKILSCEQCERIWCLERNEHLSKFCSPRCEEIFMGLQMLSGKPVSVGKDDLTWTLLKYKKIECGNRDASYIDELTEIHKKLKVVIKVMHESFDPLIEPLTRRDMVEDVIFCRWSKLKRLNFKGFYTVILEKDNELISAATVRVLGEKVAELPLVGTRVEYRRSGMGHILMNELEKNLMDLGIERLILPAASSSLHTWTTSFGFSIMTDADKLNFLDYTFLNFQGTTMCHKLLTRETEHIKKSHEPTLMEAQSGKH